MRKKNGKQVPQPADQKTRICTKDKFRKISKSFFKEYIPFPGVVATMKNSKDFSDSKLSYQVYERNHLQEECKNHQSR